MKSNEKPLISIIVPIYNVEDCVEKCVDSILAQSYKNIEIFLVDDGSGDRSGVICDKYAKKDERVVVIHKKNGGLSSARNAGIKKMNGEYVSFVDGDDALKVDCIEKLYEDIVRENADVSACGFMRFDEYGESTCSEANFAGVVSSHDAMTLLLEKKIYPSAWGKLYKKGIFGKLRYNEQCKYGEDLDAIIRILDADLKIVFSQEDKNYLYRTRANSIMGKGVYRRNCRDLFVVCDEIIKKAQNGSNQDLAYEFYVEKVLGFCMDCIKYNYKDKEELEFLRKRLVKYKKQHSIYSGRTSKEKAICSLFARRQFGLIKILLK
ncbi:MAG: glycosyltransferase family 2 protein [Candidatus Saccharibacteria bacterium]|nr:glycosyltransferase family 2 protein [Candidatus Saccharibacteria bacterium]